MKVTDKLTITNEENMKLMSRYPDNYFDLVVTSPPYDDLRDYESIIKDDIYSELYRVLKDGGVVCWNVFDAKKDGSYTGTSMKQCLKYLHKYF